MIDASDINKIKRRFEDNLKSHYGRTVKDAGKKQLYKACALTLRDEIMENWVESEKKTADNRQKQLYYLSIEFLTGRALRNNLINSLQEKAYSEAFREMGIDPDELVELERMRIRQRRPGKAGRLLLDSLATLDLRDTASVYDTNTGCLSKDRRRIPIGNAGPVAGGRKRLGNPRPEEQKEVRFGGRVVETVENGRTVYKHTDYITVLAVPYDTPIVGYGAKE